MESLASISGLATGIDFRALVEQIIEIESGRLDYLRVQISSDKAKQSAWEEVRTLLQALEDASDKLGTGSGLDVFSTSVLGSTPDILNVSASEDAEPGRHSVRVLQAAQRDVLGSGLQTSSTNALGLTGQFILGGKVIDVAATDSLQGLASRINALNFGSDPIGVSASVVGSNGAYRLVLSASETGEDGLGLLDVSGVLTDLGLFDGTTQLKNRTSGGFDSDGFSDATTAIGAALGYASGGPAGTVTLGSGGSAFNVTLDLGSQSLEDVRDAINAAASGAGASMFATIEQDVDGNSRLAVSGTAAATDAGGVLQALGILEGGRGAVSQIVQGDILTTDAGGTPATASTQLTSLFNGGSSAGVSVDDTITFEGTDHAGTAFSFTHTIQGGDTLQTLLTRLEGAEGFNGSATAEISADGRLTVTSGTAGSSRLSLSAFAGNEGGGILDLGEVAVTSQGRDRQISVGQDALVEIDGALVRSASNDISDVVSGVTFSVLGANPTSTLEVVIDRDVEAASGSVQEFVDALNGFATFVNAGSGVTGDARPALAGDTILRGILDRMGFALQSTLPNAAAGSASRLSEIGLEVTRDGTYTLDTAALTAALQQDPEGVRRLFGAYGSTSTSSLTYLGSTDFTAPGTYDVVVSQLASQATVTSAGFGGTYVDDGTADTMTITDLATNAQYQVALQNGMTLADIVAAANTSFDQGVAQELTAATTLYRNGAATNTANTSTRLDDLRFAPGQNVGFVDGTQLTFTGTRGDGSSVSQTYTVADAGSERVSDVMAAVESAFGPGVTVSLSNGQLVVTDDSPGASQLSVTIDADIPGNPNPFGAMQVTTTGADGTDIVAESVGGELRIRSAAYGPGESFSVSFSAGGGNGTASLGLAAGTYTGTDVVGTIGGEAATGVGNILTADAGTAAAGLAVQVGGSVTGSIGTVTYGEGTMATVQGIADSLLDTGDGSIDEIIKRLGESVDLVEDRLLQREERLEDRRARLLAQFVSLEQAIARAQNQQQWITAQISSLPSTSNSK